MSVKTKEEAKAEAGVADATPADGGNGLPPQGGATTESMPLADGKGKEPKAATDKAKASDNPQVGTASQVAKRPKVLHCPFAPQSGKAQVAVILKGGRELQLNINNGEYQIPDSLSDAEAIMLRDELLLDGFKDVTGYPAPVLADPTRRDLSKPQANSKKWVFMHPDQSPSNRINGVVAINVHVRGTEFADVSLPVKDGKVEVTVLAQANELYRSGFHLVAQE